MKLTDPQIGEIEKATGVGPLPADIPFMPQLVEAFGDHTFYLSDQGLIVWEWLDGPEAEGLPVVAVKLAGWSDADKTSLSPQAPEVTEMVLSLAPQPDGGEA